MVHLLPGAALGGMLRGRVAHRGTHRVAAVGARPTLVVKGCGVGVPTRTFSTSRPTYERVDIKPGVKSSLRCAQKPHRRSVHTKTTARVVYAATDDDGDESPSKSSSETSVIETPSDGVTLDRKLELNSILKFAIPLLATNIVTPLLTMTDTAFVGRCAADSVVQLAALGVSTPLTDYTVTLAAFIPAGLTNIISNGIASNESKKSLGAKTYGALLVSFVLSIVLAVTLITCPETLLGWLKTPPEVMATAVEFTKVRALGMPGAYLTTAAYAILVSRKDTTSPLACVCLAAVTNIVLDYIAVAYLGMGATGAAWATTVALWVGTLAILKVVRDRGYMNEFPWGTLKWKGQLAPVMVFFGPITFLVFALLSIYTALILFANSLGVTVSAAHRVAGNVFAVAVLCGDPLIQAGQAFMPKYLLESVPKRSAARKMAGLLQTVGIGAGTFAASSCALVCLFGASAFTRDPAVVAQVRAVTTPICAAVLANVVSKSMYGVTVAAKQLLFLAAITGVGLLLFALALWHMNAVLVGPALYYWMWWVVAGYYFLAIICIQVLSFGGPGGLGFKGLFHDDTESKSEGGEVVTA